MPHAHVAGARYDMRGEAIAQTVPYPVQCERCVLCAQDMFDLGIAYTRCASLSCEALAPQSVHTLLECIWVEDADENRQHA